MRLIVSSPTGQPASNLSEISIDGKLVKHVTSLAFDMRAGKMNAATLIYELDQGQAVDLVCAEIVVAAVPNSIDDLPAPLVRQIKEKHAPFQSEEVVRRVIFDVLHAWAHDLTNRVDR